jgi:WD40 repeat protein
LTNIEFHPTDPSLLAGGTFNGEIYLWNLFAEEPFIANSRIDEFYHREAITKLIWISQPSFGSLNIQHVRNQK